MSDKIYDFYLEISHDDVSVGMTEDIHIFKGALSDFTHVENLYGMLWFNVIDKQLKHIEYNKDGGYPIKQLTEDKIMLNWEGSDMYAVDSNTDGKFYYLGNGVLAEGKRYE
tara:strand:+ start:353 stop:685 length:333 start_codon:yes stop_codon:yes gene_type:complete